MKISGSVVALITPMHDDRVDVDALQGLVKWHSVNCSDAIVVVGSTGEGALLSEDERKEAISAVVETSKLCERRLPIIAGCGTISTRNTIEMVQNAEQCGVDVAMVVSPCYVKPSQEGVFQHFKTIIDNTSIPIIIYNHPTRTGINLQNETIVRLCSEFHRIIAIKDSSSDLSKIAYLRSQLPDTVSLLSGDDAINIGFLAQGGNGIISVTANIFPRLCKRFMSAWQNNNVGEAFEIHQTLMPVHLSMYCEPNPGPVVYATSKFRGFYNEVRLPLLEVRENSLSAKIIDEAIDSVCNSSFLKIVE
ncbi:MAG: 4-hydroxy-tetrahydrodipicolinate synthase [Holosporales bacterium]|jgi:4-hydroxy-tetrahydrodipicolinate synthase|nr:4-hydroxy-tetrahydrodipicolinate synthase [Holosporales bacterium]